jgi:hypothetical protein
MQRCASYEKTKKKCQIHRASHPEISACRLNVGSSRVEPVPPYIQSCRRSNWVSLKSKARQINPFLHSAIVHVCAFRGKRSNQSSFVEAIAVGCRCRSRCSKRVSNPACGYMKQETFETWFKAFRGAAISHTMTTCTRRVGRPESHDRYCCLLPRPVLTK